MPQKHQKCHQWCQKSCFTIWIVKIGPLEHDLWRASCRTHTVTSALALAQIHTKLAAELQFLQFQVYRGWKQISANISSCFGMSHCDVTVTVTSASQWPDLWLSQWHHNDPQHLKKVLSTSESVSKQLLYTFNCEKRPVRRWYVASLPQVPNFILATFLLVNSLTKRQKNQKNDLSHNALLYHHILCKFCLHKCKARGPGTPLVVGHGGSWWDTVGEPDRHLLSGGILGIIACKYIR